MRGKRLARPGFTLVELLVVMTIIILVSAATIPTVLNALAERGTRDGATLLQAAVVGARDEAIHANAPRGFKLLLDPAFPAVNAAGTGIDPALPLVADRWVPLTTAPDYSEGLLDIYILPDHQWRAVTPPPFPRSVGNAPYTHWPLRYPGWSPPSFVSSGRVVTPTVICVAEAVRDKDSLVPNPPASWFWNVRIGDRIRIGGAGTSYTVVGPQIVANAEGFVNDGLPGMQSGLTRTYPDGTTLPVQYLFLVNGLDDDGDGFADGGWDGIDNDGTSGIDDLGEWETEALTVHYELAQNHNLRYTITRRPVPAAGTREVALPSSVVIDLTTWGTTRERSRLPVDPTTGSVSIMVNPDGSVMFDSPYGVPTRLGLDSSFLHFWLAERSDIAAPMTTPGQALTLPIPPSLAGSRQLATVQASTGRFSSGPVEGFDPAGGPDAPFLAAQRGQP